MVARRPGWISRRSCIDSHGEWDDVEIRTEVEMIGSKT
jgi:hypothetical protein